jgi:hypothetical protein
MGGMNKAAFLARLKEKPGFRTKMVELPDFGEVTLRQLDQAVFYELQKLPSATDQEKAAAGLACLAVSIIDPDTNEPMFSAEESRATLMQLNAHALQSLLAAYGELNAVDVPVIAKNSEASPDSDSVTASHVH